jgi:hypothetical protein
MNELILISWLFVAGLVMLAIGVGYAIVEWVGERWTDRGEQL